MPIKSAMEAARANENPGVVDTRSLIRIALDDMGYAINTAEMAVSDLGDRLVPAMQPEEGKEKGHARPAYSVPLVEEVQQFVDRVRELTDRVRDLSDRVAL
jgi:hypothetical protein